MLWGSGDVWRFIIVSDDCLGNEAIRFGESGLNGLIILKVLSKIIKDKV